jgi:3-oxoacyl-[acyl-carrier-protein] synthase II
MGAVTPVGNTVEEMWRALLAGVSGAGPITAFDPTGYATTFACEVKDFRPEDFMEPAEVRHQDRFVHLAAGACEEAVKDAGLDMEREDRSRVGVLVGSGVGGIGSQERQERVLLSKGPQRVSPYSIPMIIADMAAGYLGIKLEALGPNYAVTSACASGAHAIGEAFETILRGDAEVVITGGAEAAVCPISIASFCASRSLSRRNDDPTHASRPFDAKRDGFVLGEGAAILVLETMEHARRRGAIPYGEIIGYGLTGDGYHITAPCPDGDGAARAIEAALRDAGLGPQQVDHINAHGTATQKGDVAETLAIKRVFGERAYRIPISSPKSMTGHLLGASGAVELVATLLTMRDGIVPPTTNYEFPDPECDLDYVPNAARRQEVKVAISNSFGFGGHNACLVVRRVENSRSPAPPEGSGS